LKFIFANYLKQLLISSLKLFIKFRFYAKGNARLAVLGALHADKNGLTSIQNAYDIFSNYFGKIIREQKLGKCELHVLFITALLQKFHREESDFLQDLLQLLKVDESKVLKILNSLCDKELVDLYYDKGVVQNNQSLSDYILHYYFIEEKIISITELLRTSFPKQRGKIVRALNTMADIFYTEEMNDYISSEVTEAWNNADDTFDKDYLESFAMLNMEKALEKVYQAVGLLEKDNITWTEAEFSTARKNAKIENYLIKVLQLYKRTEHHEDAIELLLRIICKKGELLPEVSTALNSYLIDDYSHRDDYESEYDLLLIIQKYLLVHDNYNLKLMATHLVGKLLDCNIESTQLATDNRTINFTTFSVLFTDGFKKMRKLTWEIISNFYQEELFQAEIHNIITSYKAFRGNGINDTDNNYKEIFQFDFSCIEKMFIAKWESISFPQSFVNCKLTSYAKRLDITLPEYKMNDDFLLYLAVTEKNSSLSYSDRQEDYLLQIEKNIKNWNLADFEKLFKAISVPVNQSVIESYSITSALNHIFNLKREHPCCIQLIDEYFENSAPYDDTLNLLLPVLNILARNLSIEDVILKIRQYQLKNENVWLSHLWDAIPEEFVEDKHVTKLMECIDNGCWNNKSIVPNIVSLLKYSTINSKIGLEVGRKIIDATPEDAYKFLERATYTDDRKGIFELFVDDFDVLRELYLMALEVGQSRHFDYQGNLIIPLIANDLVYWERYLEKIIILGHARNGSEIVFSNVWRLENHSKLISTVWKMVKKHHFGMFNTSWFELLFLSSNRDENEIISLRQKDWLKKFIADNINNYPELKDLFDAINNTMNESLRVEYFKEALKQSSDSELLRNLPLRPNFRSYSGSYLAVIDEDISFIESLKKSLIGTDTLPQRNYLKTYTECLKKDRQNNEIREVLFEW